MIKCIT